MSNCDLAVISHKYHRRTDSGFQVKGGFPALTNEIARHFHRVDLCVPVGQVGGGDEIQYLRNIKVTPLPPFRGRQGLFRNLPQTVSIMRRVVRDADIIYCMGPNDVGVLGMLVSRLEGKRMFASLDTDRAGNVLNREYNPAVKLLKYMANQYVIYPLIRCLCRDIPVFVTGNMFMGDYPAWTQWVKTTLRQEDMPPLRISEEGKSFHHIVFVGRLAPVKNISTLIRAVQSLSASGVPVQCTIVGSGQLENDLQQLADRIGAPVEFIGQVPNEELIRSRFLGADVLVLPSFEERQGKVLLEAIACSVPVVASNVGGISTVVEDGVNGLLCEPDSVSDVARKIAQVARKRELRKKIVRNGYEYARKYALDVEVNRLMKEVAWHYEIDFFGSKQIGSSLSN